MEEKHKVIRAAVYTRKSSEEGLEQEFNSLDAQYEACKSYIESQKHEGWILVDKVYSDGGISGGTMNRPSLKELLKDIEEGHIDLIVVYKIDRLTRSLGDFSKLIEILDRNKAGFVSITQQFNTGTSMGRLTLNMLLSFAQFEREIAGERVRDKKQAMAKRGMWSSGIPPLGYKLENKKIVPDPCYKDLAIKIFKMYKEERSVIRVKKRLDIEGIYTRTGRSWRYGALYNMLSNQLYIGKLPYKKEIYHGVHEGIIPRTLFNEVQDILVDNNRSFKIRERASDQSLLAGLLYDEGGEKYYPSHSTKKSGIRYRYYLIKGVMKNTGYEGKSPRQLPAKEIEDFVLNKLSEIIEDERYDEHLLNSQFIVQKRIIKDLKNPREILLTIIDRVRITDRSISIHIKRESLGINENRVDVFEYPYVFQNRSSAKTIVLKGRVSLANNEVLKKAVVQSFELFKKLEAGNYRSMSAFARDEKIDPSYLNKIMTLRFLAGDILDTILKDQVPATWTIRKLWEAAREPEWEAQRRILYGHAKSEKENILVVNKNES